MQFRIVINKDIKGVGQSRRAQRQHIILFGDISIKLILRQML